MTGSGWAVGAMFTALVVGGQGCGGSPGDPSVASSAAASDVGGAQRAAGASDEASASSPITRKLQGNWEIIRYVSNEAIPPEAMPLLAEMFETLILSFDGTSVEAGGETVRFRIEEGDGESFRLHAKGGMFDGASCQFTSADEVEVIDEGPQWPGTSLLRRMKQ